MRKPILQTSSEWTAEEVYLHINIVQDPRRILVSVLRRPSQKSPIVPTLMRHILPINKLMDMAFLPSKRIILLGHSHRVFQGRVCIAHDRLPQVLDAMGYVDVLEIRYRCVAGDKIIESTNDVLPKH